MDDDKAAPPPEKTPQGRRIGGTRHQHSDGEYYPFPQNGAPGVAPRADDGRDGATASSSPAPIFPDADLDGDA